MGKHGRGVITDSVLWQRDCGRCRYCGTTLTALSATRDHIIPKAQQGGDGLGNLVLSCRDCNTEKGDRTPEEAGMELLVFPDAPRLHALKREKPRQPAPQRKARILVCACGAEERREFSNLGWKMFDAGALVTSCKRCGELLWKQAEETLER